ncbi:hypothetical protein [Methylobacterium sp. Leaf88]|uniref:hypothetical protein n=1 Tax=Methylobacterium sp. Leaf88 TaxID=1736244 RepID=UPI0012E822F2|nr:hypothetical protein [Methylobacterium sp. Leaf88]
MPFHQGDDFWRRRPVREERVDLRKASHLDHRPARELGVIGHQEGPSGVQEDGLSRVLKKSVACQGLA